jgi:hypothetical protein
LKKKKKKLKFHKKKKKKTKNNNHKKKKKSISFFSIADYSGTKIIKTKNPKDKKIVYKKI